MKKVKKILAIIVTFCISIELMIVPGDIQEVRGEVFGEYEYEYDYSDDDETIEITKYNGTDIEVTIPEEIEGYKVTSIGEKAFESCEKLEDVIIPDSVTNIGEYAFFCCEKLKEITIPSSVTSIGDGAFAICEALKEATVLATVPNFSEWLFGNCKSLEKIIIPSSVVGIKEGAFEDCESLRDVYYPGTEEQWNRVKLMADNENLQDAAKHYEYVLTDDPSKYFTYNTLDGGGIFITGYTGAGRIVDIPSEIDGKRIMGIGDAAFSDRTELTKIKIPSSITAVGESAFSGCTGLSDVYYFGSETQWNDIEFSAGNENLQNAVKHYNYIPTDDPAEYFTYSVLDDETLEITAYDNSRADTIVVIPNEIDGKRVTSIGDNVFKNCKNLTEISIPDSVTDIGDFAFFGCISLKGIDISSVTGIGRSAFGACECIKEINFQPDLETISPDAFSSCTGLEKIVLPSSLMEIGDYAFEFCVGASDINIPSSVDYIGEHAFELCAGVTEVVIPSSVVQIDNYSFELCTGLKKIIISEGVEDIGDGAFYGCACLTEVTVPSSVKYMGEDVFSWCTGLEEAHILADISYIPCDTFEDCRKLMKVDIASEKVSIRSGAFDTCMGLTELTFLDQVTDIGSCAFAACTSLTDLTIPSNVLELGSQAFAYCEGLEKVTILPGLTNIECYAFEDCTNLAEISIPVSVTSIEWDAFYNCTSLSDIYYSGTEEQWRKISIDESGNEPLLNATIHCQNGTEPNIPDEPLIDYLDSAKQALEGLKAGDALSLEPAFQPYLSPGQIDIMESYLYTWLAELNCAYQYSGNSGVKERMMKKAGIDPEGDFASGKEQAITHITVDTKYGKKTFEITLDLGKPDGSGNLYPAYGQMHYELLQKEGIPADVQIAGQIGKSDYADIGTFVQCVSKAAEDSLHGTYQWQFLSDEMTAGIRADKTITEIIGNKNGSFSDGTFTIYEKPLVTYSKKITVTCRAADVHVFTMDGKDVGSIVSGQANEIDEHVSLHVEGETKTIFLSGNDYCLNLRGTDTGTMDYKVEELAKLEESANEEVRRTVQFLELQLKKDLQYEGYVFRPLNIDSGLYTLRKTDGSNKEAVLPTGDTYESIFKKVQELTLSHGEAALDQNRSVQLNASLVPMDASNQSLQWTTSNQSVLSVDRNGLVTAVGAGRATVTVSTRDGSFLKQYCVINVKGGGGNSDGTGNSGSTGGSGNSGSSGGAGGSGSSDGTGDSGSSGNTGNSGDNVNGSGDSGNNSDDSKPSLEPETPPVVVALHYVLQFQTNGGINLSRKTMTLLADDNPGIMPKIQRKGYVFDGWYTQQNGGEQVTGDKPLKAAATLYAHWTKAEAPKKLSALTLKSKKKGQMKVAFKKVKGAAGYQLQYSTKKGFTSKKTKQLGASAKAKTISGLKAGKEYYVRIRAYSTDSMGNKLYGKYSKAKSVKIYPRAK